ncbi:glycosyltransferase family 4 protein [Pelagicoccus sp. NFK12]|uniref:Glycosyltransferase family 4 protein n=1 Tax=Pelagicoccus enzymogenes TaxID=2773457 RepID=A0A927FB06_9BACT|nr:glycosyltransferase family 4 protein [Pelagicoccus enzymogenes]MBD5781075.1 glycosyltransferase family 4 protein [Pelagicoccus enzymogenes]
MQSNKISKIIGATYGDPYSASTYSGVPFHVFESLEKNSVEVSRINLERYNKLDFITGLIDINRSLANMRPRKNPYWRYLPSNIERLTKRTESIYNNIGPADAILQIGVAGIPKHNAPFCSHVEFSIKSAANDPVFSVNYGFSHSRAKYLARAIEGERIFLESNDLIWTNSEWTASTFEHHKLNKEKFWIHPPPCNLTDPGPIEKKWDEPNILFVGKDWTRKGGPQLITAFKALKQRYTKSTLTIIGCDPKIREPGVRVLGFLDKRKNDELNLIQKAYKDATVFCLPSAWESVGIVYMEAAIFSIPTIMYKGQGRDKIFPSSMFKHLTEVNPNEIVEVISSLIENPQESMALAKKARQFVLSNFSLQAFTNKLTSQLSLIKKTI